jgi:hypothetical protein
LFKSTSELEEDGVRIGFAGNIDSSEILGFINFPSGSFLPGLLIIVGLKLVLFLPLVVVIEQIDKIKSD